MPFSMEQKRRLDVYLRSKTLFGSMGASNRDAEERLNIVNSIENLIDNQTSENFVSVDLFLPNCFIYQDDKHDFWFGIAAIIAGSKEIEMWHVLEYGKPLNNVDQKEKYIYTWSFNKDIFKFYTKALNYGYHKELIWYVGKMPHKEVLISSKNLTDMEEDNTDSEEVILYS
jgi:hypothetical protein